MPNSGNPNLPPLPELLTQIAFPIYGLATPFLGLQLRSLHYGVVGDDQKIVGLSLFYAQQYLGSPRVMAVESSLIPASVNPEDRKQVIEWSWSNLVTLRDALKRLHSTEPAELLDDEVLDRHFQESIEETKSFEWVQLTTQETTGLLSGIDVSRGPKDEIMARRFNGPNMLLVVSMGIEPEEFINAIKQLVALQEMPNTTQRHQDEFERLTGA